MSNNLNLDQLATNQASPEVTVNDANAQLDAALTEILVVDLTTADATLTIAQWQRAVLFQITNAAAVKAAQTLTGDGTNVANGDTVTIGTKTYTFQTTLTNVDGNVQIGAAAADSITNLFKAINLSGVAGTDYAAAMTINTQVTATNPTGTTLVATAIIPGAVGNAIATTETSAHLSWGAATLAGGTGGSSVNLPQLKRGFALLESVAANTTDTTVARGTSTFVAKPGHIYIVYVDGTTNGMVARDAGSPSLPNDFHIFLPGTMSNGQTCLRMDATRSFSLPSGLSGSYFKAGTAATGSTTVTFKKNGASIGTLVWAAAGTVPTVTFASAVSFGIGDEFSIVGPATADATLADISLDMFGSR